MVYGGKYPSFWTGNNHTNENSVALFENISIEKNTPEYIFIQRLFNKTVPSTDLSIAFVSELSTKKTNFKIFFSD